MPRIHRQKVVIDSAPYNFEKRYDEKMAQFDDNKVLNVHVLSVRETDTSHREEYLVFYQELE